MICRLFLFLVVEHAVAEALELGILDLFAELPAHTFGVRRLLAAAGTVAPRPLEPFLHDLHDLFIGVERDFFHGLLLFTLYVMGSAPAFIVPQNPGFMQPNGDEFKSILQLVHNLLLRFDYNEISYNGKVCVNVLSLCLRNADRYGLSSRLFPARVLVFARDPDRREVTAEVEVFSRRASCALAHRRAVHHPLLPPSQ